MPFDSETWAKIAGGAATLAATLAGMVWKDTTKKLDGKADKEDVDRHRDHIVKLFEKLEEHARSDSEHFAEIMQSIHSNHVELLREMGKKVDR
jgi:formiminotetrahydrofolate cyclodeaminase